MVTLPLDSIRYPRLSSPRVRPPSNEHNVCGGVEFGFLSTSLGLEEALKYSESKTGEPSLVFQMQLGMVRNFCISY